MDICYKIIENGKRKMMKCINFMKAKAIHKEEIKPKEESKPKE
jgi:hypothetical protein